MAGPGFLFGSMDEVRQDITRWEAPASSRLMLQCLDIDDLDAIELIARELL